MDIAARTRGGRAIESMAAVAEVAAQEIRPTACPLDGEDKIVIEIKDDEDDMAVKLNEDELNQLQKVNSVQCIEAMRIIPTLASRLKILLCRMIYMPLVRPMLSSDARRLSADFAYGYGSGANVFYVSPMRSIEISLV